ncbi:MAG: DUF1697 domain-containing protein [Bernardetiaceae bacterium]|jgi:uncharacterized protein (DUF1697 family)|nr:DUF1697 domain-containing protein [Bernardetiaceae bacterium]
MPAAPLIRYAAFLRGINVGNIRIKMPDLQRAFAQLGGQAVVTYLQSGNVTFQSSQSIAELKVTLEQGLSQTFGYEAYVLLYEYAQLAPLVAAYPFPRQEGYHAYVLFVQTEAVFAELTALAAASPEAPYIAPGAQVIYWQAPAGQSTGTPFAKLLAKAKYKSTTTMRNLNTLEKMLAE